MRLHGAALTVICSRRKSKSSSQLASDDCAASSFESSRVSASGSGYASITLACDASVFESECHNLTIGDAYTEPEVDFFGSWHVRFSVECVVQLEE